MHEKWNKTTFSEEKIVKLRSRKSTCWSPTREKARTKKSRTRSLSWTVFAAMERITDRDSDLRRCVKLDRTSINDFTSLETKSDSRNRRVESQKLHVMKSKCYRWIQREREREREKTFWLGLGSEERRVVRPQSVTLRGRERKLAMAVKERLSELQLWNFKKVGFKYEEKKNNRVKLFFYQVKLFYIYYQLLNLIL